MNNEQMENGYMDEEMEKRVVDEKKGKRLVDEEMLKTVEEKRREYRKASERFEAVTSFLSRYSSGDSALNDDLKYLFRVCGGQPIQDVIYSTLIYEIDIRITISGSSISASAALSMCLRSRTVPYCGTLKTRSYTAFRL